MYLSYSLNAIKNSVGDTIPEIILSVGLISVIVLSLVFRGSKNNLIAWSTLCLFIVVIAGSFVFWPTNAYTIFDGTIWVHDFSAVFKILIDIGGFLTVVMSMTYAPIRANRFRAEYFVVMIAAILGAHLLAITSNFLMIFIAIEILSISSYVLVGYTMDKKGAEGSIKYFLFGSVASAIMLYGFSILFGLTGSSDLTVIYANCTKGLTIVQTPLHIMAGLMALGGFLYKIAAAPMHLWAPDVYEAAPIPVVAFLSVVPKLAGLAVLAKFAFAMNSFGESITNWQSILAVVSMLTIAVGNFSALNQNNPKRMMAYSSIAQSGFLLIGIICLSNEGLQFMIFYGTIYLIANFAVFICLQIFEKENTLTIPSFAGKGRLYATMSIALLLGFISLAGIPPTAGFTGKLFIFTSLWSAYGESGNSILIWLLVFGLLNTVISLFYYLKIPYYAFIKPGPSAISDKKTGIENYLALLLVVLLLSLFIKPDLLMGWLNRINFVL